MHGAKENNLRSIDVRFPIGLMIAVTGVSGSGKSTLVNDILYAALSRRINESSLVPGAHDSMVRQCVDDLEAVLDAYRYPLTRHTAMAVRLATHWSEAYALCTVAEPESIMLLDGSPMMVDRDVDDHRAVDGRVDGRRAAPALRGGAVRHQLHAEHAAGLHARAR